MENDTSRIRQNRSSGYVSRSPDLPRKQNGRRRSKNLSYQKLEDGSIKSLVNAGYRVRSRNIHVLPN